MIDITFNPENYEKCSLEFRGEIISCLKYQVTYAAKPCAPDFQIMNIFVREDMKDDHSAPIFFVHRDGGVGESEPWSPEMEIKDQTTRFVINGHVHSSAIVETKKESVIARILKEGFVIASPAVRGRETKVEGCFVGRGEIPQTIIDLKAAVRYLRHNRGLVPGNPEKIISEGASSGGGSSALLGASGNSSIYSKYLEEIGAADERDDVYMAIVDSPIHDFEHIDIAYEWQFGPDYAKGLFADDPDSAALSREAANEFIKYVDELKLINPATRAPLSITDGSYTDLFMEKLNESLNVFLGSMTDEEKNSWLEDEKNRGLAVMKDGRAEITSFSEYITWNAGRWMKYVGCYDGFDEKPSRENEAFGPVTGGTGHFSVCLPEAFGRVPGHEEQMTKWKKESLLNADAVRKVNPYIFITGQEESDLAKVWYVRDGGNHETTGAIFFNMCLLLEQRKDITLDWRFCWQQNHTSISLKEFDETVLFLDKIFPSRKKV